MLGIPLVLGLVLTVTAVSPAGALGNNVNANIQIELSGDDFSVSTEKGGVVDLISIQDTDAEDILAGFNPDSGALYVRTVNHFAGAKEEPLFDMNSKTTGGGV